ncbi:RIB43A-like with coiled-coils protein 2 [Culicoides brevitarsis]|uniref:RIB43A-like with coiled-coils protein 2 n=1 Tax=Culicoides brevitarsis TaxID=469753 RepID=UPI00307C8BB2
MLNLKVAATKNDLKEAAMIEQRRKFEEERKKRIFNAKERVIGIDKRDLEQQIAEKERLAQQKAELEQKYLAYQDQVTAVVTEKEREMRLEKQRIQNELNEYRAKFQRPEDRREWDLYDPRGKKKDLPARLNDTDPRLTISSAQKFEGEDLSSEERRKAQIEQQRAWLLQQMREKKEAEEARKEAERLEMEALIAREARTLELQRTEREGKLKMLAAVTQFNKELANEQENRRKIKEIQEQEDNLAEQLNHITSDILTEAPDAEKSNFGPHRIIPYSYRRMTQEQIDELKAKQKEQLHERQKLRDEQKAIEDKWDQMTENQLRTLSLIERDEMRKRHYELARMRQENEKLADEQNREREFIEKKVYTNEPTDEYYGMFNTTSR